jgi:hypothetical protein
VLRQPNGVAPVEFRSEGNTADLILPFFSNRKRIHETFLYLKHHSYIRFDQTGQAPDFPLGIANNLTINPKGIQLFDKLKDNQRIWEIFAKIS